MCVTTSANPCAMLWIMVVLTLLGLFGFDPARIIRLLILCLCLIHVDCLILACRCGIVILPDVLHLYNEDSKSLHTGKAPNWATAIWEKGATPMSN